MQNQRADPAGDIAESPDLLARVANPQRIIWINQIDDPRLLIDHFRQLFRSQPIAQGRIVDWNFAYLRSRLPRELHRPFPTGIGRHEIPMRLAIGAAHGSKRGNCSVGNESRRALVRQAQVFDDAIQQGREPTRRCVGVKLFRRNRVTQRLAHPRMHRQVIRVLAQPEQVLRGEQAVEMSVALLECAHCRFGRGLITEP